MALLDWIIIRKVIKMKFIEISLETHNLEDPYYTYYKDKIFYTNEDLSNDDIKNILNSIKPKQFEDTDNFGCGEMEIDDVHLIQTLSKYKIYPLSIDVMYCYDIEEEDNY